MCLQIANSTPPPLLRHQSKFKGLRKKAIDEAGVGDFSINAYSGCIFVLAEAARELHSECFKPHFTGIFDQSKPNSCTQQCPIGVYTSDDLDYCKTYSSSSNYKCKHHHDSSGPHKRVKLPQQMRQRVQERSLEIAQLLGIDMANE
jgi:hypothetical protein